MGLPPWETSGSQLFALVTGANSGLGYSIAARLTEEFLTSPSTPSNRHLILILCTRSPIKTRFTISRLRAHLRTTAESSNYAKDQQKKAKAQGIEYKWEETVQRVHFVGVEVDLCDLKSVYTVADKLVNGTVGSPEATTMDGLKLPHGSPGTYSYSPDVQQDRWALSQKPGSTGVQRSWGWGLRGLRIPRLDVIILSAGIGGWIGIDWPLAVKEVLTDLMNGVTWPTYKLADVGAVVSSQLPTKGAISGDEGKQPLLSQQKKPEEPPLGKVFCSNVFGHYLLAHKLMPLLSRPASPSSNTGGKIIWMSSIEAANESALSLDDIQGLQSEMPYESSKRLEDILALTSDLPSVQRASASFFDPSDTVTSSRPSMQKENNKPKPDDQIENNNLHSVKPRMYVTHPGIFASDILPLNAFLVFIYKLVFYFVRWIGSPWHTIDPWQAAVAPVWVALAGQDLLEDVDGRKAKWGSATDASGAERVVRTEVPGWGWDGTVGGGKDEERRKGRKKGAVDLTKEAREDFEVLGVQCWNEMEQLRKKWEVVLGVKAGKK